MVYLLNIFLAKKCGKKNFFFEIFFGFCDFFSPIIYLCFGFAIFQYCSRREPVGHGKYGETEIIYMVVDDDNDDAVC